MDTQDTENQECDREEEVQAPPSKRPRIRMDITHPPGTFSITSKGVGAISSDNDSRKNSYSPCLESVRIHNFYNFWMIVVA